MRKIVLSGLLSALLLTWGCGGYEYKPVPFKAAESYANHATVFGAVVAAHAWTDPVKAKEAFGFDVKGANITPVQVIVDNKGPNTLNLLAEQALIQDAEANLWNILPAEAAYERIDKQITPARTASEALKKGGLGAVAGGILGAAFGIVTGRDVADSAYKGAVAGGAVGTVAGGAQGLDDPRSKARILGDLQSRNLQDHPLAAREISHGFLFFPGEIKEGRFLRLKIRNQSSGDVELLELPLR